MTFDDMRSKPSIEGLVGRSLYVVSHTLTTTCAILKAKLRPASEYNETTKQFIRVQELSEKDMAQVYDKISDELQKMHLFYRQQAKSMHIADVIRGLNQYKIGFAGPR